MILFLRSIFVFKLKRVYKFKQTLVILKFRKIILQIKVSKVKAINYLKVAKLSYITTNSYAMKIALNLFANFIKSLKNVLNNLQKLELIHSYSKDSRNE